MGRRNSTRIEFHDTWKLHAIQVSSSISKLLVHSPAHAPSMALLPRPHPLHRPVTATATFARRGQRRVAATRPSGPRGLKHLLSPLKTGRLSSGKGWWCAPGAGQALGSRGGAEAGCCRAVGCGLRPCLTQGPHARPPLLPVPEVHPSNSGSHRHSLDMGTGGRGQQGAQCLCGRKTESPPGRGRPRSPGPPGKQGLQRGTGVGAGQWPPPWSGP